MKKRGFIFTNKTHSERAIMGAILGVISLGSLSAMTFLSYRKGGEVGNGFGVGVLLAALYAAAGLWLGAATVREKERYRFFPFLGILLNFAALAAVGLILYAGGRLG